MSAWDDTPSDINPDAVVNYAEYQKARARFEGRENVIDFNRHKRAHNQTALDLANAFRSMELAKYDDEGKK